MARRKRLHARVHALLPGRCLGDCGASRVMMTAAMKRSLWPSQEAGLHAVVVGGLAALSGLPMMTMTTRRWQRHHPHIGAPPALLVPVYALLRRRKM